MAEMPPTDPHAEYALLARLKNGDEAAFTALYRRHKDAVYRFALLYCGAAGTAADVTQDTFVHLMTKAAQFDPTRGTVGSWLCGVARNVAGYIFDGKILASVSYTYKVNHRDKQRRYLHHLIWHQIDSLAGTLWEDPEWVALNQEGFEYGLHSKGGVHDRSSESGLLSSDYPGFINRYGTGNVPDDKADLFAYLMVAHHWVEARAAEDPFLRAKVSTIKKRLAEFDPVFDAAFWEQIDAVQRDVSTYFRP